MNMGAQLGLRWDGWWDSRWHYRWYSMIYNIWNDLFYHEISILVRQVANQTNDVAGDGTTTGKKKIGRW